MKALITGASSGIGKDMAYYLHELGHEVVLVARDEEKLKKIKKELGKRVEIIVTDIGKYDNCIKLHNKVRDIDILINNAGFGLFGEFDETDINTEMNMIDVNVRAMHVLMKLYLQDMIKKDKGYILNVASIAGFMPGPLLSTYYATKNYVVRLCQGVREELRRKKSNVYISLLCPGPVKTNFDNVAGVKFSLRGMKSRKVARYAIDKMFEKKFIIVPGIMIKLLRGMAKIIPDGVMVRFVYMAQKRKN